MKILLITLLFLTTLYSTEKAKKHKNLFESTLDLIEEKIEIIHNNLNTSSKYIDEYITDKEDDLIYTDSFIRIENSIEKFESDDIEFEPNIDIRLALPKLKDKFSITIDNNDENIINQEYQDSNERINQNDDNYNIGLLYNTMKKDINLKFKIGLKTTSSPYFYAQGTVGKQFTINKHSSINLEEKLKYSHKNKFDNYFSFRYNYDFNEKYSFHNYNEYHVNSKLKDNNTHNSIRLHHKISNTKYLNYVVAVDSNDYQSNFKTKEYQTYVSYRNFIRKWLYYDIVPSLRWERDNDFDRDIGLKLTLGVLISK